MKRCDDCNSIFEDCEMVSWKESHGETQTGCPHCRGTYTDATPCVICGDYPEDEYSMESGVCMECIEDGVRECFDEYLDAHEESDDMATRFYVGDVLEDGYAHDRKVIIGLSRMEFLKTYEFFPKETHQKRMDFIAYDKPHFAEWLMEKEME